MLGSRSRARASTKRVLQHAGKFSELLRETVRKVPKVRETWPRRAPKRRYLACFGPGIPTKLTLGALLAPLFGQFRHGVLRSCASLCNPSYLVTLRYTAGLSSPVLWRRQPMAREESFFDDLARGLADGTLTRGKALRLMGAAVLGASLGSLSGAAAGGGVAWADDDDDCKPRGRRCKRNRQCCSKNCIENPSGSGKVCGCPTTKTPCGGRCVTNCTPPKVLDANCQCVCESGQVECSNGSCVSNSCPDGQSLNTTTCQCECPPGQVLCNGSCVSNSCSEGQIFDPSRCTCVAQCLPEGGTCTADEQCCVGLTCCGTPLRCARPYPFNCTEGSQCCSGICFNGMCQMR